jgi:hypothetical protein
MPPASTKEDPTPAKMRAYRARLRRGFVCVSVLIDAELVECLVQAGLLLPDQVYERNEISDAVSAAIKRLAKMGS